MNTFEKLKKENGAVVYDGIEYALYDNAYATNNSDGELCYESLALTEEMIEENGDDELNTHAIVQWEVYPEWLEEDDTDESNACDWDNPVSVNRV